MDRSYRLIGFGIALIWIAMIWVTCDRWHSEAVCKADNRAWICTPDGSFIQIGNQIILNETCTCR